jgi:hypothetical protein
MMHRGTGRLVRCAAALQCIAEEFREFATPGAGARDRELHRFAGLLDHMAASLMVPAPVASAQLVALPAPERTARADQTAPRP